MPAERIDMDMASTNQWILGVDVGTTSVRGTVIRCKSNDDDDNSNIMASLGVVTNIDMNSRETPCLASFLRKQRWVGEAAVSQLAMNGKNTISEPLLFAVNDKDKKDMDFFQQFDIVTSDEDVTAAVRVDYVHGSDDDSNESTILSVEQIMSMILADLKRSADVFLRRHACDDNASINSVLLSMPLCFTDAQRRCILDSAKLAGLDVVGHTQPVAALGATLAARSLDGGARFGDLEESMDIAIVDMGRVFSHAAVLHISNNGCGGRNVTILSSTSMMLGVRDIERKLANHVIKLLSHHERHPVTVPARSKLACRLVKEVSKALSVLSANPSADLVLESFGGDADYRFRLSRSDLESLCTGVCNQLETLVTNVIQQSGSQTVVGAELVGGGTRIPMVKTAISRAFGCKEINGDLLRYHLDSSTAVAAGVSYLGSMTAEAGNASAAARIHVQDALIADPISRGLSSDVMSRYVVAEASMSRQDEILRRAFGARNELEERVYAWRSALNGPEASLLTPQDQVTAWVNEAEDWLYAEECETATADIIMARICDLEKKIKDTYPAYFSKLAEKKLQQEAAEAAEKERLLEEQKNINKDDHDFRKLPKSERMRHVLKNKAEGLELFKDNNYAHAAQRWIKALSHCSKFFDLSDDDKAEVNALKLSLSLNISMCFLKLEAWAKAAENAKDALDIDNNNVKALYRRATALEKLKDYQGAMTCLTKAAELSPDDKSVARLSTLVESHIQAQIAREKKMYGKMFG